MREPYKDIRSACLACLNSGEPLTRKAGQFLGGEAFAGYPLSDKQLDWLGKLLERCKLPPLGEGVR